MITFKSSLKQFPGGTFFFNVPKSLIKDNKYRKGDNFYIIFSKSPKEINFLEKESVQYRIFFEKEELHGYPICENPKFEDKKTLKSHQLKGGQEKK